MKTKKNNKIGSFLHNIKKKIINFYNKKIKKSKIKFNMLETIIIMLIIFGLGLVIGGIIMYGKGSYSKSSISLLIKMNY